MCLLVLTHQQNGNTPQHAADNKEVALLLQQHGANITLKNKVNTECALQILKYPSSNHSLQDGETPDARKTAVAEAYGVIVRSLINIENDYNIITSAVVSRHLVLLLPG